MDGDINTSADTKISEQSPPPIVKPAGEVDNDSKRSDNHGPRQALPKSTIKPDHWGRTVEAWCAIFIVCITAYYALQAARQAHSSEIAAYAAKSAADTAHASLVLSQRPWIKVKLRIIKPLTFNTPAWKGPVAGMVIEDALENVGSTVALNVLSWEDLIPVDPDQSIRTALVRRTQWCDANRHPDPRSLSGFMLFPKDPIVEKSTVGPSMEIVMKAAKANPNFMAGKVAFVLVGCVSYRSTFEPITAPRHETRFVYYLGEPQNVGIQPFVDPHGVANKLRLVEVPDELSAD